jgi:hypothetical protein
MSQFPPGDSVPYASYLPPQKLRPTSVTVIAIIAIVFGSLSLLSALCGIGSLIMNATGSNPFMMTATSSSTVTVTGPNGASTTTYSAPMNPGLAMARNMKTISRDPLIVGGNTVSTAVRLILAIVEIWAGASLLGLKPAARIWILRYAVADIVVGIAILIFQIAVVQPKMLAIMQSAMPTTGGPIGGPQMAQFMRIGVYAGDFFILLLLIWPIVILYFMTRPMVKAAFV